MLGSSITPHAHALPCCASHPLRCCLLCGPLAVQSSSQTARRLPWRPSCSRRRRCSRLDTRSARRSRTRRRRRWRRARRPPPAARPPRVRRRRPGRPAARRARQAGGAPSSTRTTPRPCRSSCACTPPSTIPPRARRPSRWARRPPGATGRRGEQHTGAACLGTVPERTAAPHLRCARERAWAGRGRLQQGPQLCRTGALPAGTPPRPTAARANARPVRPAPPAYLPQDSERMLQFFRESGQQQPAVAERMAARVQRSGMILRLLMVGGQGQGQLARVLWRGQPARQDLHPAWLSSYLVATRTTKSLYKASQEGYRSGHGRGARCARLLRPRAAVGPATLRCAVHPPRLSADRQAAPAAGHHRPGAEVLQGEAGGLPAPRSG